MFLLFVAPPPTVFPLVYDAHLQLDSSSDARSTLRKHTSPELPSLLYSFFFGNEEQGAREVRLGVCDVCFEM